MFGTVLSLEAALLVALLIALGGTACEANAGLLIVHRQFSDGPLTAAQKTSARCRIQGHTRSGDVAPMFDGMLATLYGPVLSLDQWPAPNRWESPQFHALSLDCQVWGPHFDPPQAYHAVLDALDDFWRVPQVHDWRIRPAQDKHVVLLFEDYAFENPNAPGQVWRGVRLRGTVEQQHADGHRTFVGSYRTRFMLGGPLSMRPL